MHMKSNIHRILVVPRIIFGRAPVSSSQVIKTSNHIFFIPRTAISIQKTPLSTPKRLSQQRNPPNNQKEASNVLTRKKDTKTQSTTKETQIDQRVSCTNSETDQKVRNPSDITFSAWREEEKTKSASKSDWTEEKRIVGFSKLYCICFYGLKRLASYSKHLGSK